MRFETAIINRESCTCLVTLKMNNYKKLQFIGVTMFKYTSVHSKIGVGLPRFVNEIDRYGQPPADDWV